jgi:hypothetical protein
MRNLLCPAILLLCGVTVGAAQRATPAAAPAQKEQRGTSPAGLKCEPLSPTFRSDASKVVKEKIGPKDAVGPTGNTYSS